VTIDLAEALSTIDVDSTESQPSNSWATKGDTDRFGAWVRYGDPLTDEQIAFAIENYRVAILQPWETEALRRLKSARPDMVVLCYKCLSSTRDYEPGPIHTSGVSYHEAMRDAPQWFARRDDGSRIEWNTYPGHWQMAVWDSAYRKRWCANVVSEVEGTLWDGVMADNDVFDDYYGLNPPIDGGLTMDDIRTALDSAITEAGTALASIGKILVPNIAESRRQPGRWERHARFGGGYEEVWLAWGPDDYLDPPAALAQTDVLGGAGITIIRVATDGNDDHKNFTYGLAAFWIYGGSKNGAFTATGHDDYSVTPFIAQLRWDLGEPTEKPRRRGNGRFRKFTRGWAAVNFNAHPRRKITFNVPGGLVDADGMPAPERITLGPHEGVLYRRPLMDDTIG
jgi:hypothetical protein